MTVHVRNPKTTFIHIPKTGGVSVSNWLINNAGGEWKFPREWGSKHFTQKRIEEFMPHPGFTFTIIRNPWDRVASAYHYYKGRKKLSISFAEFIDDQWINDWGCVDKPQSKYFYDVDSILSFENLDQEFKEIQNRFERTEPLSKLNDSGRKRHYSEDYTEDWMINKVGEKHKEDIDRFGYKYEYGRK